MNIFFKDFDTTSFSSIDNEKFLIKDDSIQKIVNEFLNSQPAPLNPLMKKDIKVIPQSPLKEHVKNGTFDAVPNSVPAPRTTDELWSELQEQTRAYFNSIKEENPKLYLAWSEEGFNNEVSQRFRDIPCIRETAVMVKDKYIHANRVGRNQTDNHFIASQLPLEQECEDFWTAILDQECTLIVDLTTEADIGKEKRYYHDGSSLNNATLEGGNTLTLKSVGDNFQTYRLKNFSTQKAIDVIRLHFSDWLDFSAVSLGTLEQIIKAIEEQKSKKIWFHCRAGVGRTGTLIACYILKEKIETGAVNEYNLEDSVIKIIFEMRKERGPSFVQKKEQFELILQYARKRLNSK